MMVDGSASTLIFADRRRGRVYPVTDATGAHVALIRNRFGGARFVAEDSAGLTLCAGSAGWWGLSNRWLATDSTGEALLELRKSGLRARAEIWLERGGEFVVHGSLWRRDFEVRDGAHVVLSAVPQAAALSLRPYEYAVRAPSGRLTLAEVVAVVQIWRLVRKRDDASSAAAASTVVAASS
jgi:uncharacterized protein YxjI